MCCTDSRANRIFFLAYLGFYVCYRQHIFFPALGKTKKYETGDICCDIYEEIVMSLSSLNSASQSALDIACGHNLQICKGGARKKQNMAYLNRI